MLAYLAPETGQFSIVRGMGGSVGGYWVGKRGLNPLEDQTVIGLLSDTGHPWISQNFQAIILDVRPSLVHLNGVFLAIKWRFAGGPMMTHFLWYLDPLSPHQL